MQKRDFLNSAVLGLAASAVLMPVKAGAQHAAKNATGPTLLTVTGLIGPGNRPAFDPARLPWWIGRWPTERCRSRHGPTGRTWAYPGAK